MTWLTEYKSSPIHRLIFKISVWAAAAILVFLALAFLYEIRTTTRRIDWLHVGAIISSFTFGVFALINAIGLLYWSTKRTGIGFQRIAVGLYPAAFAVLFYQFMDYRTFDRVDNFLEAFVPTLIGTLIVGAILVWADWVISGFSRKK